MAYRDRYDICFSNKQFSVYNLTALFVTAVAMSFSVKGSRVQYQFCSKQGVSRWKTRNFFVVWLTAHGPCSVARSVTSGPWSIAKRPTYRSGGGRPVRCPHCHTVHNTKALNTFVTSSSEPSNRSQKSSSQKRRAKFKSRNPTRV